MEKAAKTAPRVPKLGYKGGRVPQLSTRVTLVPSGARMVRHMLWLSVKSRYLARRSSIIADGRPFSEAQPRSSRTLPPALRVARVLKPGAL